MLARHATCQRATSMLWLPQGPYMGCHAPCLLTAQPCGGFAMQMPLLSGGLMRTTRSIVSKTCWIGQKGDQGVVQPVVSCCAQSDLWWRGWWQDHILRHVLGSRTFVALPWQLQYSSMQGPYWAMWGVPPQVNPAADTTAEAVGAATDTIAVGCDSRLSVVVLSAASCC
jgi:hypothetical protein